MDKEIIAFVKFGPKAAAIAIANMRYGTEKKISVTLMMISSTIPPTYPEKSPTTTPKMTAIETTNAPISIEILDP
jgi:hypothetical protein